MESDNQADGDFGLRYDLTLMPLYGDNANANNYVGDMNFREMEPTFWLATLRCAPKPMPLPASRVAFFPPRHRDAFEWYRNISQ